MIDKTAIQEITKAAGITQASAAVKSALEERHGVVALPDNYKTHDLEPYMAQRRHFRGRMTTTSLSSFAAYVHKHQTDASAVFVDIDCNAVAVLNAGSVSHPGHCDHTAVYEPPETALFAQLHSLDSTNITQTAFAELLEDSKAEITSLDSSQAPIEFAKAVSAVRNLTVDGTKRLNTVTTSLSESRGTFEQVSIRSEGATLPAFLAISCQPNADLPERTMQMRVGYIPGEKATSIRLRFVRFEQLQEQLAKETQQLVIDKLQGVPVFCGEFAA
jgi:uncharacterized protein YfdQ (DUF2303 family)